MDKGFVEHWQRIGPILERIRQEELRNFRHEDHVEQIDALLQLAWERRTRRTTSGLVDLQRIFRNATR